jgi:hypothetical protein
MAKEQEVKIKGKSINEGNQVVTDVLTIFWRRWRLGRVVGMRQLATAFEYNRKTKEFKVFIKEWYFSDTHSFKGEGKCDVCYTYVFLKN